MKNILFLLAIAALLTSCGSRFANKTQTDYAATITQDDLKRHLTIYASDEFGGRDTGEESAEMAVNYLVEQYKAMEIGSPINDYKQAVPLKRIKRATASITIAGDEFKIGEDFINYFSIPDSEFNGNEIAFVGHGIHTDAYSNYKDINVENKIVIMKLGEPMTADSTFVISNSEEPSKWSNLRATYQTRKDLAVERGAAGMIMIFEEEAFQSMANQYEMMTHGKGRIALDEDEKEGDAFYSFFANEKLGNAVIENVANIDDAKMVKKNMSISYKNQSEKITADNVVASIKGSEKPDEYIVISAHLDHVGTDDEGNIYNGADDDGSGTVAVLEIAEAFKRAKEEGHGPERSIIFLHVTGEEKGLLGSKYYTDFDPVVPLGQTVSNLNIDMIGRVDPKRKSDNRNYLYLIGSDKLSTELHDISEMVNEKHMGIEFDYTYNAEDDPNRFYYRSDHYNFAKNDIPVIFYFNGTHDDYHQPSDTIEKIEWDLLENRARLIFHTAWELANREKRIVVDKVSN